MAKLGFRSIGEKVTATAAIVAGVFLIALSWYLERISPNTCNTAAGQTYPLRSRHDVLYLTLSQSRLMDAAVALFIAGLVGNVVATIIRERNEKNLQP